MSAASRRATVERRAARDARRGALSGSGPTSDGGAPGRNPGAIGAFGLFGEVLLLGVLVTVAALPLVTLPAAFAAAIRHLRRYVAAEASGLDRIWADFVRALAGGVVVGLAVAAGAVLLAADVIVAGSGALPGGRLIAAVGWVGLVVLGVALLSAASAWDPADGWRSAVQSIPERIGADPVGALYFAATIGFVGLLTWVLPPLLIPALGCAALAAVAVPERPRRG